MTKQLNKLVNVLKIVGLDHKSSTQRELLLVKARADRYTRSLVPETAQLSGARSLDHQSSAARYRLTTVV